MSSNNGELLKPREAAAYLRRSKVTLDKWRCEGRGPTFIKADRHVLYRRTDLDRWLDSHAVNLSTKKAHKKPPKKPVSKLNYSAPDLAVEEAFFDLGWKAGYAAAIAAIPTPMCDCNRGWGGLGPKPECPVHGSGQKLSGNL